MFPFSFYRFRLFVPPNAHCPRTTIASWFCLLQWFSFRGLNTRNAKRTLPNCRPAPSSISYLSSLLLFFLLMSSTRTRRGTWNMRRVGVFLLRHSSIVSNPKFTLVGHDDDDDLFCSNWTLFSYPSHLHCSISLLARVPPFRVDSPYVSFRSLTPFDPPFSPYLVSNYYRQFPVKRLPSFCWCYFWPG